MTATAMTAIQITRMSVSLLGNAVSHAVSFRVGMVNAHNSCMQLSPSLYAVCDDSKETTTSKFIVMWKDFPGDTEDFFKDLDVDVELLYDWDEEASVYEAEDIEQANAIMEDIIHILEGDCE
jgi:hypothetical protein